MRINRESPSYRWVVFATIGIGTFFSLVDMGIVNLALPTIEREFKTNLSTLQWVTVGYALAISVLLLPFGRMGDMLGRKRLIVAGLALFIVAVIAGGVAQNITWLIMARAFQGVGAALIQANGMATILSVFPDKERGKAMGSNLSVVGAGAVAGPAIGGVLVETFGWRSVFFVNIPFLIVAIVGVVLVLEGGPVKAAARRVTGRYDWVGAVLSGVILLTFLMGLSQGQRQGWTAPPILLAWALLAAALVSFIWWELRIPNPMLDLRLFKKRLLTFGVLSGFGNFMAGQSVIFLMTFYVQLILGFEPRKAGLIMLAGPLCLAIMGPISGRLSDRYGWQRFNVIGQVMCGSALFLFAFGLRTDTPLTLLVPIIVLMYLGMGLFNTPNNSSIMSAVDRSRYGVVSALTQLVRNSANVTSIAIATTIVAAALAAQGFGSSLDAVKGSPAAREAFVTGMHRVYFAMAGLTVFGLVLTLMKGERVKEGAPEHVAPATTPAPSRS